MKSDYEDYYYLKVENENTIIKINVDYRKKECITIVKIIMCVLNEK